MSLLNDVISLGNILETMVVPAERKFPNKENTLWLKRNLGIKNSQHDSFKEAMYLIGSILRHSEHE